MPNFLNLWSNNGIGSDDKNTIETFLNIVKNCQTNNDLLFFFKNIQNTPDSTFQCFLKAGAWKYLCERFEMAFLSPEASRYLELFLSLPLTQEFVCGNNFLTLIKYTLNSSRIEVIELAEKILSKWSTVVTDKEQSSRIKPIAPFGVARAKITKSSRQDMFFCSVIETEQIKKQKLEAKKSESNNEQKKNINDDLSNFLIDKSTTEKSAHEYLQTSLIDIPIDKSIDYKILNSMKEYFKPNEFQNSESQHSSTITSCQDNMQKKIIYEYENSCDKLSIDNDNNLEKNSSIYNEEIFDKITQNEDSNDIFDEDFCENFEENLTNDQYPLKLVFIDLSNCKHYQHVVGTKSKEKAIRLKANSINQSVIYNSPENIPYSPAEPDSEYFDNRKPRIIIPDQVDPKAFQRHSMFREKICHQSKVSYKSHK